MGLVSKVSCIAAFNTALNLDLKSLIISERMRRVDKSSLSQQVHQHTCVYIVYLYIHTDSNCIHINGGHHTIPSLFGAYSRWATIMIFSTVNFQR